MGKEWQNFKAFLWPKGENRNENREKHAEKSEERRGLGFENILPVQLQVEPSNEILVNRGERFVLSRQVQSPNDPNKRSAHISRIQGQTVVSRGLGPCLLRTGQSTKALRHRRVLWQSVGEHPTFNGVSSQSGAELFQLQSRPQRGSQSLSANPRPCQLSLGPVLVSFFFLMIRRPPRSTLFPLHDALPISQMRWTFEPGHTAAEFSVRHMMVTHVRDRKSTRLNSSHRTNSYAVFCLKKKTSGQHRTRVRRQRIGRRAGRAR